MPNDFLVMDHGSIVAIRPLTEEAVQWLDDNVAAEAGGGSAVPSVSTVAMRRR